MRQMLPDDGNGGAPVTLADIQQNTFGRVCINCHVAGGQAAFIMRLDDERVSYANLVNQVSFEKPPMLRVSPGDPEASYLVWKIEGREGILGERMPPPSASEPKLPDEEIAAIRQWILDGAAP